jgi:hypothetical protein
VPPPVRAGGQAKGHEISLQENRALEFFYRQTAQGLSGFFGQSFWKGCVLHLSLGEPAVRHAIASLGTMHQALCHGGTRDPMSFALQSYNRSIRLLAQRGVAGPDTALIFIVCSIVFTCFEFLRGNVEAALTHVTSGINILSMVRRQRDAHASCPRERSYSSFESSLLETELAPILSTLSIATSQFGAHDAHGLYLNPVDTNGSVMFSDSFDSIAEARFGLMDLTTALIKARQDHSRAGAGPSPEFWERLRHDLEHWKLKFDDLVRRQQDSWGRADRNAADVVRIMSRTTHVGISLCSSATESAWDAHRADFEDIVSRAEVLLSDREPTSTRGPSQGFSVELGLTCPLHMVAWKCRWPRLRRRGLALLLRLPKRDFIFDSEHHHAVFSRIMEIEEACFGLPPGGVPDEERLPPEHVRVHHFRTVPRPDLGDHVYAVTFLTKPDGLDRGWHSRTECLDLDSPRSRQAGTTDHTATVGDLAKSDLSELPLMNLVGAIIVRGEASENGAEEPCREALSL